MIFTIKIPSKHTNEKLSFYEHLPQKIREVILDFTLSSGDNDIIPSDDDIKMLINYGDEIIMQTGEHEGKNAIENAMQNALKAFIPNSTDLCKANGILILFEVNTYSSTLVLEISKTMDILYALCCNNQDIIFNNAMDTLHALLYSNQDSTFGIKTNAIFPLEYTKVTIIATRYTEKLKPVNN